LPVFFDKFDDSEHRECENADQMTFIPISVLSEKKRAAEAAQRLGGLLLPYNLLGVVQQCLRMRADALVRDMLPFSD
jgi:hypothetical protein